MNTSQLPNLPVHPSRRHPLTGQPIQAIGHRKDGRVIWPIMGGSEGAPEAPGPAAPAGDPTPAAPGAPAPAPAAPAAPAEPEAPAAPVAEKVEDLPEWAQKTIRELRQEAGDERVATKTLAAIQKALDPNAGEEEKVDPAKLTADLTTERTAHTNLQREHQVLLAALDAGADHAALLDSRSFLTKVADLDPAADDFAAKVKAAVDTAVTENPKLKAGRAPGASSVDHPGGSGEQRRTSSKPKPLTAAVSDHYGT